MIDWFNLLANSLWILGCVVALATLSYGSWQSAVSGEKLRLLLETTSYQKLINLAGVLFCAGLAATSDSTWGVVLWAFLGALFLTLLVLLLFRKEDKLVK